MSLALGHLGRGRGAKVLFIGSIIMHQISKQETLLHSMALVSGFVFVFLTMMTAFPKGPEPMHQSLWTREWWAGVPGSRTGECRFSDLAGHDLNHLGVTGAWSTGSSKETGSLAEGAE